MALALVGIKFVVAKVALDQIFHNEGVPQIRRNFADLRQDVIGGERDLASGDVVAVDLYGNVAFLARLLGCCISGKRAAANKCGKQGDGAQVHFCFHVLSMRFWENLSRYDVSFRTLNAVKIRQY